MPFLTGGVEYAYGRQGLKDSFDREDHRVAVGVQVF